ncbi:hypothetical protein AHAS_Ahas12G0242400 [Arachis hypogaea]
MERDGRKVDLTASPCNLNGSFCLKSQTDMQQKNTETKHDKKNGISLLNCYVHARDVDRAESIMEKMRALGFARSILSRNGLLNLYHQTQNYDKLENFPRYRHVKKIDLEFARDIDNSHLILIKQKCFESLQCLESLNLNGCQKISDTGIEAIISCCPQLKNFSIYWNNCKYIVDLNISGCKNISDHGLQCVAENYPELITDDGLKQLLHKCLSLQSLNLYALSSFTDEAYKKICLLEHLKFLDLCGAQNLSDEGLSYISKSKNLASLNLTWCVRVTDKGVISIAQNCTSLEFLSLFGLTGVTDKCLEELSKSCSDKITTLDVNGCIGIKRRSREELLRLFPNLKCFKVHS